MAIHMKPEATLAQGESTHDGQIARAGLALAAWSERWFPDPFVFALVGVVAVFVIGLLWGEKPTESGVSGGKELLGIRAVHHADDHGDHRRLCCRHGSVGSACDS